MDENSIDLKSPANLARSSLDAAWEEIGCVPGTSGARFQPEERPLERETPGKTALEDPFSWLKGSPHPNYTMAAACLQQAEDAYQKNNFGESLNCVVQARDAATTARLADSSGTKFWGVVVFVVSIIYFAWALNTLLNLEYNCSPQVSPFKLTLFWTNAVVIEDICKANVNSALIQRSISIPVFFWGFLGGVVWCMHGLYRWYSRRLFDKHYLYWYILNPWVAAVLGGMFVLTVLSGIVKVDNINDQNSSYLLHLTSFVVGLATHDFLKLLIRIVSAIFGQVAATNGSEDARV